MIFIPNIISIIDIVAIKKFMEKNNTNTFKPVGDNRIYFFSESYQVFFDNEKLLISSIYKKSENSPDKKMNIIIQNLCKQFYEKLKENHIDFQNNECQLNVFLTQGNINNKVHIGWHRDEDSCSKKIPEYIMVVLLDEPNWMGGNLQCQYIGDKDVYDKKINSPIIKFVPQFRGGVILRNTDTRHMVDKIIKSTSKSSNKRTVIVLQLYKQIYAYD